MSFAGIMAFIFSDLVVFPVVRISAQYFGWKMALYIVGVFLVSLCLTAIGLHFGFEALGLMPSEDQAKTTQVEPSERFAIDYTLVLNVIFVGLSVFFAVFKRKAEDGHDHGSGKASIVQRVLQVLAGLSMVWLAGGLAMNFVV